MPKKNKGQVKCNAEILCMKPIFIDIGTAS